MLALLRDDELTFDHRGRSGELGGELEDSDLRLLSYGDGSGGGADVFEQSPHRSRLEMQAKATIFGRLAAERQLLALDLEVHGLIVRVKDMGVAHQPKARALPEDDLV